MRDEEEEEVMEGAGSRRREDGVAFALFLVLAVLFFWEVVFLGRMFLLRDTFCDEYPWREFARSAIRSGVLPHWNPYSSCGKPFLALPKAAVFYPVNLLLYAWPSLIGGLRFFYVLHFVLAGFFAYLLGREWKLGMGASLVMGVIWAFNGFIVTRIEFQSSMATLALYPLVFLLAHRMLWKPSVLRGIWLSLALSAQFLAGNTPDFYLCCLGVAVYAVFYVIFQREERGWRGLVRPLYLIGPAAGFVLLCAVQLVPTYHFMKNSWKALGEEGWEVMASFHPLHYAALIVPGVFGGPGYENYWGRTLFEFSVGSVYVSALGAMLVIASVLSFRKKSGGGDGGLVGFLWLVLAFSLLLSAGQHTPFYRLMRGVIPLYDRFRWPAKALLLSVFALTGLAGFGMRELQALCREKGMGAKVWFVAVLTGVWVLLAGGLVWGLANPQGARNVFWRLFYKPLYGGPGLNPEGAALAAGLAYRQGVILWTVSLMAIGLFVLRRRGAWMSVFLPAFIFADLFANNAGLNATAPARIYEYESPVVKELKSGGGMSRVFSPILNAQQILLGEREEGVFRWASDFLVGETSLPHGIFKVHGGGTLRITELEVLVNLAGNPNVRPEVRERVLDLMGVDYETVPAAAPQDVVFGEAKRGVSVSRREGALPRAYVVRKAVVVPDGRWRLQRLMDVSFDARNAVMLEELPREEWMVQSGRELEWSVGNVSYELNAVSMDVELDGYGFLVVSDTYFPGWTAEVDGKARRIYRANAAFRAVALEPGKHRVEMRYEAKPFRVGVWISLTTAVALALIGCTLGVVESRRRRRI